MCIDIFEIVIFLLVFGFVDRHARKLVQCVWDSTLPISADTESLSIVFIIEESLSDTITLYTDSCRTL